MSGNILAGPKAMVRDSDSVAEFRYALQRIVAQLDKHDERINQNANDTREHVLKCEAANVSAARDLSELRKEMEAVRKLLVTYAKYGIPALAVILAIQILGVERAWNVMDTVKAIRMAVPVP